MKHLAAIFMLLALVGCGRPAPVPVTLPSAPGAHGIRQQSFHRGKDWRTLYVTPERPGAVLDFYRQQLPSQGWISTDPSNRSPSSNELTFRTADKTVSLDIEVLLASNGETQVELTQNHTPEGNP